jgi:chromosome segregation ATPase
MTELQQEVIVADEQTIEVETPVVENQADNDTENQEEEQSTDEGQEEGNQEGDDSEFPKKAVNALNRKSKQLNKARASLQEQNAKIRELEAKLASFNTPIEQKSVNADDFETMDDYLKAQMDALVENKLKQTNTETEKAQLTQEQQRITQERDEYIATQAADVAKSIPDFTQTIQPYLQTLDTLPQQVADIFYSMENAPAAAYVLAKEGKLGSLPYANPYVAAAEIMSAHERGKALLSKPQNTISSAPEPMKSVKGQVKTTKNLMEGSVLKNLGLKS